ncbi:hypothetical protein [Aquimarina sp. AU58]|uniref:hypothetical protein n=1 Tax=Aquimarina sp. AU58 TaxID=1874112 RepID=UPI000D6E811A|nr:hypothetical protein [Aquimarina sp. AU58]
MGDSWFEREDKANDFEDAQRSRSKNDYGRGNKNNSSGGGGTMMLIIIGIIIFIAYKGCG